MKILAIPATNSRNGLNRQIVDHAARLLESGELGARAEVDVLDLNEYEMPLYSVERQRNGFPEPAQRFLDEIGSADGLVISFAEHNGSYSVAWKNVYDWASRIDVKVYQGRPTALFSTSPGGRGGRGVLEHAALVAPFFGADVVGSLSIPRFADHFDRDVGELTDPDLRSRFREILTDLLTG